jgi:large subunit ribosomal protein L27Ae
MRHFHLLRNRSHCPGVNVDKLWSLLPEGTLETAKGNTEQAPLLDVTQAVS